MLYRNRPHAKIRSVPTIPSYIRGSNHVFFTLIAVFGCYSKGTSLILRCDPWKWLKNPLFSSTEITLIFITFFAITMGFRTLYSLRKNDSGNVKRMRPKPFWDYFRIFQGFVKSVILLSHIKVNPDLVTV